MTSHAQRRGDQRQHANEGVPAFGEARNARAVGRQRQVALEPVLDRHHARDAVHDGLGAGDIPGFGHGARKRDHAFADRHLDRGEGGQFGEYARDPLGNALVVARILRRGDGLDRGWGRGRFGGGFKLRRQRHRPQQGKRGEQSPHWPATDMPSMRKVGTSIPRCSSRSPAGTSARNISGSVPAMVISATGPASSPLRMRSPLAPRL